MEEYHKIIDRMKPEKLETERKRIAAMKAHELEARAEGCELVLGIDEVGRGPLCGPVVTCCCVLDPDSDILLLNDSKKLSEKKREILSDVIMESAVCYAFGEASPQTIDEINILNATKKAMREACESCIRMLEEKYQRSLRLKAFIDGNQEVEGLPIPQETIVKGDSASVSIAAASILAKVRRDHMLEEMDKLYPGYGFARNKGYGTREHVDAIRSLGPAPIHRMSFLKGILKDDQP